MGSRLRSQPPILSEPKRGQVMDVHVDTHATALLGFANGAIVQMGLSFDVPAHKHVPLELYGTEASLIVPDPNFFGGDVEIRKRGTGEEWTRGGETPPYAAGNYQNRKARG